MNTPRNDESTETKETPETVKLMPINVLKITPDNRNFETNVGKKIHKTVAAAEEEKEQLPMGSSPNLVPRISIPKHHFNDEKPSTSKAVNNQDVEHYALLETITNIMDETIDKVAYKITPDNRNFETNVGKKIHKTVAAAEEEKEQLPMGSSPNLDPRISIPKKTPETVKLKVIKVWKRKPDNCNFETNVAKKIHKTVAAAEEEKEQLPMGSSPNLVPRISIPKKTPETVKLMPINVLKITPDDRNFETNVGKKIHKTVAAAEEEKEQLPVGSSPNLVPRISIPKHHFNDEKPSTSKAVNNQDVENYTLLETITNIMDETIDKVAKRKPDNCNFETNVEKKIHKTVAAAEQEKEQLPMGSSPNLDPRISIPKKTPETVKLKVIKVWKRKPDNCNFETNVAKKIHKTVAAAEEEKEQLPMGSSPNLVPRISIPKKTPETVKLMPINVLKITPDNRNFETNVGKKIHKTVAAAEEEKEQLPMGSSPNLVPRIPIPKKTPETVKLMPINVLKITPDNRNFETNVGNKIHKTVAAAEEEKELPMQSSPILVPRIPIPKKTPETVKLMPINVLKITPDNRNFETNVGNKIHKTVAAAEEEKELPMQSSPILVPRIPIPKKTPETVKLMPINVLKITPDNRNFETNVGKKIHKTVAAAEEEKEQLPMGSSPNLVPRIPIPKKTPETVKLMPINVLKITPDNRNFETNVGKKIHKTVAAAEDEKEQLPMGSSPNLVPRISIPKHHFNDEKPSTSKAVNNQDVEHYALLETITNIMDETIDKVAYKITPDNRNFETNVGKKIHKTVAAAEEEKEQLPMGSSPILVPRIPIPKKTPETVKLMPINVLKITPDNRNFETNVGKKIHKTVAAAEEEKEQLPMGSSPNLVPRISIPKKTPETVKLMPINVLKITPDNRNFETNVGKKIHKTVAAAEEEKEQLPMGSSPNLDPRISIPKKTPETVKLKVIKVWKRKPDNCNFETNVAKKIHKTVAAAEEEKEQLPMGSSPNLDPRISIPKKTPETVKLKVIKVWKRKPDNCNFETNVAKKIHKTVAAAEEEKEQLPMGSSQNLVPRISIPKKTPETVKLMPINVLKITPDNRNFETNVGKKIHKTVAAAEEEKEQLPMGSSPNLVPRISIPKHHFNDEKPSTSKAVNNQDVENYTLLETITNIMDETIDKVAKRKPDNCNFETNVEKKIHKTVAAAEQEKEQLPMGSSPNLDPRISIPKKTPETVKLKVIKVWKRKPDNCNFETNVAKKIHKTVAAAEEEKEQLPMGSSPNLVPRISIPKKTPETVKLMPINVLKITPDNRNFETNVGKKIHKTVAAAEEEKEQLPMGSSPNLVPRIPIPKKTPETVKLMPINVLKITPDNRNFETNVGKKIHKTVAAAEEEKEQLPMGSSPNLDPRISIPKKTPETVKLKVIKVWKRKPDNCNFETNVAKKIHKTVAAAEEEKEQLPMGSSPNLDPRISIPKKTPETVKLMPINVLKITPDNRNFETNVGKKIHKTVAAAEEEKEQLPMGSSPNLVPRISIPKHHFNDEKPSTSKAVNNQDVEHYTLLETITNIMDETIDKVAYKLK